jgi:hypothetical protein
MGYRSTIRTPRRPADPADPGGWGGMGAAGICDRAPLWRVWTIIYRETINLVVNGSEFRDQRYYCGYEAATMRKLAPVDADEGCMTGMKRRPFARPRVRSALVDTGIIGSLAPSNRRTDAGRKIGQAFPLLDEHPRPVMCRIWVRFRFRLYAVRCSNSAPSEPASNPTSGRRIAKTPEKKR